MKGFFRLSALAITIPVIIGISACSPTYQATTPPDDVYYSKGDPSPSPQPAVSHSVPSKSDQGNYSQDQSQGNQSQDYYSGSSSGQNNNDYSSSSQQYTDSSGNQHITNNYYGDYYDYSYSSRLRRYYAPVSGYGYYDPYYTNSYYYDYNPASWGMSIYLGYNFWGPSFGIGFGYGYGYGYPYYGYPYYGYPYYGGYYGYGYPYYPYHSCYYNPYYYNSFEGNNSGYYYGPRSSKSGNGKSVTPPSPRSVGSTYQQAVAEHRVPNVSASSVRGVEGSIQNPVRNNFDPKSNVSQGTPVRPNVVSGSETSPVRAEPSRGLISQKNQTVEGQGRPNSTSGKGELAPIPENYGRSTVKPDAIKQGAINGGTVRPNIDQLHGRPNQVSPQSNSQPKNDVRGSSNNSGGNVRPNVEQPSRNIQHGQPGNSQPRQRNYGSNPNGNSTRPGNLNYDRPQMRDIQPRFEQKMEPRQFRQQNSAPSQRGGGGISAPQRSGGSGGGSVGGGGGRSSGGTGGGGGRRK